MKFNSLIVPGLCLLGLAIFLESGLLAPSLQLLAYSFYGASLLGLLLARRFHSSRIFFALLVLLLSQRSIEYFTGGRLALRSPGSTALAAVGILFPLNFMLLSLMKEKGFTFSTVVAPGITLFLESAAVAMLCRPTASDATSHVHRTVAPLPLPLTTELAFAIAVFLLLARYILYRKPSESGLLWSLVATFLALRFGGIGRIPQSYFAGAACLLVAAVVETSYLLAYHDELTSLPSRRAFHEGLLRLEPPYSIAMLDIDHFKRCNDTYGHETGDDVLRMVASRLASVTGGGKAYRCGGEEFAIVFNGKKISEVLEHLENLRASIEASSFRLRGKDRRQESRGTDRRKPVAERRSRRSLKGESDPTHLSVTASIGVAEFGQNLSPEEVIAKADQALYRAKAGGRNRIETEFSKPRKPRARRASIA